MAGLTVGAGAGVAVVAVVASSSSCSSWISVLRILIDLPSDRAASGSFFDPNSTRTTTAMMRIFQGLSNRSPSISALFSGEPSPHGLGFPAADCTVRAGGRDSAGLPDRLVTRD